MAKETLSVRVDKRIKQQVVELIEKGIPATVILDNALWFFLSGFYEFQKKYGCTDDFESAFTVYVNNYPLKIIDIDAEKIINQYNLIKKYFEKKR